MPTNRPTPRRLEPDRLLGAEYDYTDGDRVRWRVQVSAVTGPTERDEVTVFVARASRGPSGWRSPHLSMQRMPLGLLLKGIEQGELVPAGPPARDVPSLVKALGRALAKKLKGQRR